MATIDVLITAALALVMFGIGSSQRIRNFSNLFYEKKPIVVGLMLQMVFLPLFAMLMISFSDLPPLWKAGLFIVAICPGGTASNFISYIVRAEIALSIALTTINSVLILFTIPFLSNFALAYYLQEANGSKISVSGTFVQVLVILILPALTGVIFNEVKPLISKKIQEGLRVLNSLLIALVFGIKFFADKKSGGSGISLPEIFELLPWCLLLHFGTMVTSYFVARFLSISRSHSTTIGIEVGLQNTALAILVTGTLIGENEMTKPALVFAMFSFFTTLGFAWLALRR